MDESDSENEGQLLIDESVDTPKRTRGGRKRGITSKKTPQKKKTPLKLVVKATTTKTTQRGRKPRKAGSQNSEKNEEDKVANVRTSTRVKKRARKHSPSPVRAKKEPPKKKLKVKIKPVPKQRKKKAAPLEDASETTQDSTEKDLENVDIESVSDDELLDIQYSSVIVDEDPAERPKKSSKPKKKAGIKLKLSLGKVLAPKIAETLSNGEEIEKLSPDDEISTPSSPEEEKHIIKPLIISKRMVSSGMSPKTDSQISALPTGNESPYYSSSSEDHKPLTLRLSVGRPKVPRRSISEFQKSSETPSKAFPSIQRSWSVTKPFEPQRKDSSAESAIPKKPTEPNVPIPEKSPASQPNLSTTPYFSAGLQSLLDVVSVEIKEQNKGNSGTSDTNTLIENLIKHSSPPKNTFSAPKISPTKLPKSPSFGNLPHSHEGHLPSMKFPKPALHFVSKKRPRSKSVTNTSPQRSAKTTPQLDDTLEIKDEEKQEEEAEETPDHILTEKERRRRDKKKVLNDDFVDPDTVLQGSEPEEKKPPKKKPLPSYIPKTKGGFSLLMPEMKSQPPASEPKLLQMGSTCSLSSKGFIPRRPKKGLATAKQRLANKLKIRKTFAY